MQKFLIPLICLTFISSMAYAEVCATVWPCDELGALRTEYASGSCASYYRRQCDDFRGDLVQEELRSCISRLDEQQDDLQRARQRVKRLRTRLQRAIRR